MIGDQSECRLQVRPLADTVMSSARLARGEGGHDIAPASSLDESENERGGTRIRFAPSGLRRPNCQINQRQIAVNYQQTRTIELGPRRRIIRSPKITLENAASREAAGYSRLR